MAEPEKAPGLVLPTKAAEGPTGDMVAECGKRVGSLMKELCAHTKYPQASSSWVYMVAPGGLGSTFLEEYALVGKKSRTSCFCEPMSTVLDPQRRVKKTLGPTSLTSSKNRSELAQPWVLRTYVAAMWQ